MLSQIDAGDDLHYHLPVRLSLIKDVFIERETSIKVDTSTLIEKQVGGLATNLVRLYFRFVHPVYPILQKKRFLQLFRTNRGKISPALRGCIYGIGARWLSFDDVIGDRPALDESTLIAISRTALDRELESPNLESLQTCLLMLHETPQPTSIIESPRLWACVGQAVSVAQSLGLHMDPMSWRLENWEKALRKKLWWSVFQADKWYDCS